MEGKENKQKNHWKHRAFGENKLDGGVEGKEKQKEKGGMEGNDMEGGRQKNS